MAGANAPSPGAEAHPGRVGISRPGPGGAGLGGFSLRNLAATVLKVDANGFDLPVALRF
jgi:hypothetical protein